MNNNNKKMLLSVSQCLSVSSFNITWEPTLRDAMKDFFSHVLGGGWGRVVVAAAAQNSTSSIS